MNDCSSLKLLLSSILPIDASYFSKFLRQQLQGYSFLTVAIVFRLDEEQYYIYDSEGENLNELGIVIEGSTCRNFAELSDRKTSVQELLHHKPPDLFLGNGAIHRQYSDAFKDYLIAEQVDPMFFAFREKSLRFGCCLESPILFCIFYVYCEKIGNISEIKHQQLNCLTYADFL